MWLAGGGLEMAPKMTVAVGVHIIDGVSVDREDVCALRQLGEGRPVVGVRRRSGHHARHKYPGPHQAILG